MEEKIFQLVLNSKIYTIPSIFKHLVDISTKVSSNLIFESNHRYQVESKVNDDTFESFLKYLVEDELPDIQLSNIHEYHQLSQEFQILTEAVEAKMNELGEYFININALQTIKNSNLALYEEQIAIKLDEYLQKYGKELLNVPIQNLFNIFNHKKCQLTQHDLAYNLIKQNFEKTKNLNIFILLNSLDGSKLSKSNYEESLSLSESRMNCMPSFDFSYLSNSFKKQQNLEKFIEKLEQKFDNFQRKNEEEKKKLIEKFENDKQEIISMYEKDKQQLINEHEEDKKNLTEKFENDMKKMSEKLETFMKNEENFAIIEKNSEEIEQLNAKVSKLCGQVEDLTQQKEDDEKTIKEMKEQIQKFEKLNQDQIKIKSNLDELQKENKEYGEIIEHHKQEFDVFHKKFGSLTFELNLNKSGILGELKKMEKNPFDRLFVASQSSRDVYNLIDPNTKDDFRFYKNGDGFIEFYLEEEIEISGIQIFSSFEYFPKSFKLEIDGNEIKSISEASELNGPDKNMTVLFNPFKGQKVRFVQTGPNWDKNNGYIRIKKIEILSNDSRFSKGVFSTFIEKAENHDPHKCPIFISPSHFSFNKFYNLDVPISQNICTYDIENSWFQIELTRGFAILKGFRLKRCLNSHKTKNYKIICTDDFGKPENSWNVLIEINEKGMNEHKDTDIYQFPHPSPPAKFIRIVQTGKTWSNDDYLAFCCFDIYGSYF